MLGLKTIKVVNSVANPRTKSRRRRSCTPAPGEIAVIRCAPVQARGHLVPPVYLVCLTLPGAGKLRFNGTQ